MAGPSAQTRKYTPRPITDADVRLHDAHYAKDGQLIQNCRLCRAIASVA